MQGTAVVIGGGIGGVAAAALLAQQGWSVTLRERRPTIDANVGTALVLRDDVVRALNEHGISGVRSQGAALNRVVLAGRGGSARLVQQFRPGKEAVSLSRPALLALIRPLLSSVRVETAMEADGGAVGALRAEADLIVCADGINSTSRMALFGPGYRACFRGSSVWRGTTPGDARDLTEFWSRGARFGISARDGGTTNWYATIATPHPLAGSFEPADHQRTLTHVFAGWNDRIDRVLARIDATTVLHHDVYDLPKRLPSYVTGNAVLVGDAAHAMTPDLGRGAAESLLDAHHLAHALRQAGSVPAGLRAYDQIRRRRTQRTAAMSRAVHGIVNRQTVPLP